MWNDQWTGKTIGQTLAAAAGRYGDKVAMVFQNGSVTFNQLQQTSDLIARAFLALGVDKGDKVAVWMAGYSEWAYIYFALAKIGAIMVAVNTRYRPEELDYVLNKAKASVLILKEETAQQRDYLALLSELCPGIGAAGSPLPSERLPYLQKLVLASKRKLDGCILFESLLTLGAEISAESLTK
jgi:fatty-acyl-CoA synthase